MVVLTLNCGRHHSQQKCYKVIRVGSDFSGMGSFELAAKNVAQVLNVNLDCVFACEKDPKCQSVLLDNHCPEIMYAEVDQRDHLQAPACDWFGAGFPCQAFSICGKGQGIHDQKDRGLLVAHSLDYVRVHLPRLVLLENVVGLTYTQHRPLLAWILVALQDLGYECYHKVLNTAHFGIPQRRERLYIVAILKHRLKRPFLWPEPVPTPPLDEFLSSASRFSAQDRTCVSACIYFLLGGLSEGFYF